MPPDSCQASSQDKNTGSLDFDVTGLDVPHRASGAATALFRKPSQGGHTTGSDRVGGRAERLHSERRLRVTDPVDRDAPVGVPDGPLLRLIKDRRIAFLAVGGFNTVVGYLWFVLFQVTIGQAWGYMWALIVSHVASVLCAFVMHRRFVFRVVGHWWRDLLRFEIVQLTALGVNIVALPALVEIVGLTPLVAQALVVVVTVTFSYFAHRHFSFRRKATE